MNPIEQSIKAKLKTISQKTGINFNELWLQLVTERLLFRFSRSNFGKTFIFKGGLLLGQYIPLNRITKDIDFSLGIKDRKKTEFENKFKEILKQKVDDGIEYSLGTIEDLQHPQLPYGGYKIQIDVSLGKMRESLSLDIGFDKSNESLQKEIRILPQTNNPIYLDKILLQVYTPEFIFAEKLEACVSHHTLNSRMKDYHDLFFLIKSEICNKEKLIDAIQITFSNRETTFSHPILDFEPEDGMKKYWQGHLRKAKGDALPTDIGEIFKLINSYVSLIFKE